MTNDKVTEALHIVFDGPPGPEAGRFVEVETPDGRSVNAGEWHERAGGLWELRLALQSASPRPTDDVVEALQSTIDRVEHASNMFHNSQYWHSEQAPDGEGTLWVWIFAPAYAALATPQPADPVEPTPNERTNMTVIQATEPFVALGSIDNLGRILGTGGWQKHGSAWVTERQKVAAAAASWKPTGRSQDFQGQPLFEVYRREDERHD